MREQGLGQSLEAGRLTHPHLTQGELAQRWQISARTLEKWRQCRAGPRYVLVGGRVRYPLLEVEAYERDRLRGPR